MNPTRSLQLCRWMGFLLLAATSTIHATELPSGVSVSPGDDGRNRVVVSAGEVRLSVDGAPVGDSTAPGFSIATGSDGSPPLSKTVELVPINRSGLRDSTGAAVNVESEFTFGTAERQVVIIPFGRRATASDAVIWLPVERVLITGRLCDRVGLSATSQSDSRAWIEALTELLDLEPDVVIPGRGAPGGRDLLTDQLRRLREIRSHAESALLNEQSREMAVVGLSAEWYTEWLTAEPDAAAASMEAVYDEVGGLTSPWELIEHRKLREGPSPTRSDPGWTRPTKVLWRNSWPDRLGMLQWVAPDVEIVPFENTDQALAEIADADGLIGTANAELLSAGKQLRWVQVGSAGVERYLTIPELKSGDVLLTNGQRLASEVIGEHVMALTRALARGLNRAATAKDAGLWQRSEIGNSAPLTRLRGKTLLVVGLGGIGTEVARLADGAGMRVIATRNSRRAGPPFVDKVGLGEDLPAYMAEADVVVNCLPMTPNTEDIFDSTLFDVMKPTAFFINVGRGGTVDTDALVAALVEGKIAGAGLDVTDPEPLPEGHPLWQAPNLIITPHFAAWSDEGRERRWLLYRENLRRFVAGERLLSVVDPVRGY